MNSPYEVYRPTKVPNGSGGFTETPVLVGTVWGSMRVFENAPRLEAVDVHADLKIGDFIKVEEEAE